ncbi:MAG: hypothetical protein P0S93_01635 [Candidatus Neptunochlamydia sp.]|nr:hypothetical protein [Candidatus Neptunochlamydia sp.]
MEETAKERIKRKKKERAELIIKEVAEPKTAMETPQPTEINVNREGVDMLAIYPFTTTKPKYIKN